MKNLYDKWNEFTGSEQYCLYMSEKQFFGKRVKNRLSKKWYHRYLRERNKEICRCGQKNLGMNHMYFGRYVYTYWDKERDLFCYTPIPIQKGCRRVKQNSFPKLRKTRFKE